MKLVTTPSQSLLTVAGVIFAVLIVSSLIRLIAVRFTTPEVRRVRLDSLKSWWIIAVVMVGTALVGPVAAAIAFLIAGILAMREFMRLALIAPRSNSALLVYCVVPIQYLIILLQWRLLAALFIPVVVLTLLSAQAIMRNRPEGFLRTIPRLQWGLLISIYFLSHAVMLFTFPESINPVAGTAGLFLYLLVLTETNDIAQALIGRRLTNISSHKIAPHVSPNKAWEGWAGGCVTTVLLACFLAPWLTPFAQPLAIRTASIPYGWAILVGVMVSAVGLIGDLNMSNLKRDAGVKDSGTLLPGQGGMLDRIDSLTFTAPPFYYLVYGVFTS